MIIREIYVGGFGKLTDFRMSFNEGLNTVLAENGWGKSTALAFIAAMLFGLEDTRSTKLSENPRKKYQPWGSSVFGGSLTFETEAGVFRVERSFGKKSTASEDTYSLISLDTGKESDAYGERLGEELFGIDKEGFLHSAYLSERQMPERVTNPTVTAKLSSISLADADMGGYDRAVKLLDDRRRFYQKKKGGGGEIKDTLSEASFYEDKLARLREAAASLDILSEKIAKCDEKITALRKKRDEYREGAKQLDEKDRLALIAERRAKLAEQAAKAEAEYKSHLDYFGGKKPPENLPSELSRLAWQKQEKEKAQASLAEQLGDSSGELLPADEELATAGQMLSKKHLNLPLLLIGILLSLLAIPLIMLFVPLGIISVISGALLIIVSIMLYFKSKSKAQSAVSLFLTEYGFESPKDSAEALASLGALAARATAARESDERRLQVGEQLDACRLALCEIKLREDELYASLGVAERVEPEVIAKALGELTWAEREAQRARAVLDEFLRENKDIASASATGGDTLSREKLSFMLSGAEEELLDAERERVRLCSEYEATAAECERRDEYESRYRELIERANTYTENLSVITKTEELLAEAKQRLTARYLGGARRALDGYLSALDGEGGEYTLDTDFTLTKTALGKARGTESLSRGESELYRLAVRLALTDALFDGEYPPILLDDPFVNLDDGHLKKAKEQLEVLAKTRQIIYFTCSEARA